MALLNKTPMARREALSYCRRCLAVMLCCVLVSGLTFSAAPRAKAVAVVDDVAILGLAFSGANMVNSFAQHPVEGSLGQFVLAGSGVDITSGVVTDNGTTYYDPKAQELGVDLVTHLVAQGGEAAQWIGDTVAGFQAKGGLAPGDSFSIPAAVVAATRQWAQTALNFGDDNGVTSFNNRVILGENGPWLLTVADLTNVVAWTNSAGSSSYSSKTFDLSVKNHGSLYAGTLPSDYSAGLNSSYVLKDGIGFLTKYSVSLTSAGNYSASYIYGCNIRSNQLSTTINGNYAANVISGTFTTIDDLTARVGAVREAAGICLLYSESANRLYSGMVFSAASGKVRVNSLNYYNLSEENDITAVATTMTKTPAVDETPVAPTVITLPTDLPTAMVGGYTAPLVENLTQDVLTGAQDPATPTAAPAPGGLTIGDIAGAIGQAVPGAVADGIAQALPGAIAQALPITGAIAGDQVVGEVAENPAGLGAVFISKFPFCIPWDIVKAIQLLAAPPVIPRWELDFMQPIAGRVGGFHGSTNLVLDFSDYPIVGIATRWVSTVLFVYALASGTKRMLWTS